jgi:GNAT superfamily N-acetyltransferase/predicted nucleic acid-binding protein
MRTGGRLIPKTDRSLLAQMQDLQELGWDDIAGNGGSARMSEGTASGNNRNETKGSSVGRHVQYVVRTCTLHDFDDVVGLGDKYKTSLGLMRYEAYREYLAAGTVFGVYADGELCAYALFALPRREIRLAHLVVAEEHRGHGLAALLIDSIRAKYSDLQGIFVRCRPDWDANAMWPHLGFVPLASLKGRAASGSELTSWRLDFGHGDLFSAQVEETTALKVVLDTNIVLDLGLPRSGEESQVLEAPWLSGEVLFCTTNGVHNEVNQHPNQADRKRLLSTVSTYANLYRREHEPLVKEKFEEWIGSIHSSGLDQDPSLTKDCRLIAEAAIAGADVFVTRDERAARTFDPLAASLGTRVLSPTELVVHLDELQRSVFYSPVQIQRTSVSITEASAGSVESLDRFLNTGMGEKRSAFRKRIAASVRTDQDPTRRRRLIYMGESSEPAALIATRHHGPTGTLEVPILRIVRGKMTQALTLQLLYLLRSEARDMKLSNILISDPAAGPDPRVQQSFERDGLSRTNHGWSMFAIGACGPWDDVRQAALAAARMAEINSAPFIEMLNALDVTTNPQAAAEVERLLWPAKATDSALPSYIVPIRPTAASQLLGHDLTLFDRPAELGLSRRHVYYKSTNYVPKPPGRILWYVSTDKLILGCSRLVSTRIGTPVALHERYKSFGVWDISDVRRAADDHGQAAALIFADTEIFARPVNYHRAVDLAATEGISLGTLPGPRPVPPALFDQIYKEGSGYAAAPVA